MINITNRASVPAFLAQLNPKQRFELQKHMESMKVRNITPYTSRVSFIAQRVPDGAGGYTYTLPRRDRIAFGYGRGDPMTGAGEDLGVVATNADTNMIRGGTTNNNEHVAIFGISAFILPGSDPELWNELVRSTAMSIKIGAGAELDLGRLEMMPSSFGTHGEGRSTTQAGPFDDGGGRVVKYFTNGMPIPGQMLKIDKLNWQGISARGSDTTLAVKAEQTRDIILPGQDRAFVSEQVAAFTAPLTKRVDVMFQLHTDRTQYRTENA